LLQGNPETPAPSWQCLRVHFPALHPPARYFVYKLYEATGRQPMQWATLHGLGESRTTISRAVERGWVILQDVRGKPLDRKAALTDEGRRLARKG